MLGKVGVLILVNKNVLEMFLIALANIWVISKQDVGVYKYVVEIHHASHSAACAVCFIYLIHQRTLVGSVALAYAAILLVVIGHHKCVFCVGYDTLHGVWFIHLVVKFHIPYDLLYECFRVVCIVDCDIVAKSYFLVIVT